MGHSNTQLWPHAHEVYSDGFSLPSRPSNFSCKTCAKANSQKVPPRRQDKRTNRAWDLLHTDITGLFSSPTIPDALNYITFINDYSNFPYIRFLKKKLDALQAWIDICELICNEHGAYPRAIRSDRGGEYINKSFHAYCLEKGIKHEPTAAYTLESNGKAERFNLTLANMVQAALLGNIPKSMWAEAFNWACHLRNLLPLSTLQGRTSLKVFYNTKPSIGHFKLFYSPVFVYIPENS